MCMYIYVYIYIYFFLFQLQGKPYFCFETVVAGCYIMLVPRYTYRTAQPHIPENCSLCMH